LIPNPLPIYSSVRAPINKLSTQDAPRVPPNPINLYGCKRACDDFALLVKQLGCDRIIILGHDWGGMVVWRMAQWYADLVTHVIVVCTSYARPQKEYISIEQLVASGRAPQFGYHLQLASPEVEHRIESAEDIRKFLHGMYGARGPNGETGFSVEKGLLFENLDKIGRTPLLTDSEMDYYVSQYSRNGLHGIENWYRTRKANWEDELDLIKTGRTKVEQPTLFIQATRDRVFTPATMVKMGESIPKLTVKPVEANHWVLWEKPAECNAILEQWLKNIVLGSRSSL